MCFGILLVILHYHSLQALQVLMQACMRMRVRMLTLYIVALQHAHTLQPAPAPRAGCAWNSSQLKGTPLVCSRNVVAMLKALRPVEASQ